MNRKIATWSLGVLGFLFVLGLAVPSSANFTQDTIVLNSTTDTESIWDTGSLIMDVAGDSTGYMYVLHRHFSASSDTGGILITKFNPDGTFREVITVDATPTVIRPRKMALAVNRHTGAMYVAVADSTAAFLYTATNPADAFDSVSIGGFKLPNMTASFGFIDVAVFGTSAQDSVFVVGVLDSGHASDTSRRSGIMLWRFAANGRTASPTDSVIIISRVDTSTQAGTSPLTAGSIASKVNILAISQNAIAVVLQGVVANLDTEGLDSSSLGMKLGNSIDTEVDTGVFYDTFQVSNEQGTGSMKVLTSAGVDRLFQAKPPATADSGASDTPVSLDMFWDATNNQVVIYYQPNPGDTLSAKLRRIVIPGGEQYSADDNTDISSEISIPTSDSRLTAVSVTRSADLKEHVALRTAGNNLYYVKRVGGTTSSTTNLDFDTVGVSSVVASDTNVDRTVGILTTADGAPRVFYPRSINNSRYIIAGRPQGAAVTTTNVTVTNSQTASSSTTPTFNVTPAASDSSAVFAQYALTATSATQANTSTITDFSGTPTYTATIPMGNVSGDTLTCLLNSTVSGVQILMRRPLDTNPEGGFGTTLTSDLDTANLGGLTDTMFQVCAATAMKVRLGRSDGTVFADNAFSDSMAIRLRFVLTPAFIASLVAAGVDTSNLTVWSLKSGESKLTQIGNSTSGADYAADLKDGGILTITSNTITSFSTEFILPGVGSVSGSDGGICVIGRCVNGNSGTAASLRQVRDALLTTKLGRVLTSIYYNLK